MEPICWAGLVGVIAITAAVVGLFKGTCQNANSSGCGTTCDCDSKKSSTVVKDSTQVKENNVSAPGVDESKEKAINDLLK